MKTKQKQQKPQNQKKTANYIMKMTIEWCILGDCNQPSCHHCFPVKNCSKNHTFCKKYGCCEEIFLKKQK